MCLVACPTLVGIGCIVLSRTSNILKYFNCNFYVKYTVVYTTFLSVDFGVIFAKNVEGTTVCVCHIPYGNEVYMLTADSIRFSCRLL
jgi:hypothetical protein